ncbi:hypothetical protein [Nocardioides sp. B-3]|uniref:hypothetical protein n=1 Tax=Nocardioides sp. B-3 TaxID=2895565 RepID=UPI002152BB47|nr:hypothetical protein [Nocardioides sp. B-3]UUZ58990.1 hypothetical protein LP418_23750 [Nocardioides sp. B-3]
MTEQTTPETSGPTLTLLQFPEKLAIVRLGPGAEMPKWAESASLFSMTATATETSVICATRTIPTKTPHIGPLTAFRCRERSTPTPWASRRACSSRSPRREVPVYTLSTFDTDWIMVRLVDGEKATEAWRRRGHTVIAAVPAKPTGAPRSQGKTKTKK